MKQVLRKVLSLLFVAGVTLALWPAGQHLYGWWSQRQLLAQWPGSNAVSKGGAPLQRAPKSHLATQTPRIRKAFRAAIAPWEPTRISIPEIGLDAVVVQGVDDKSLARGPGHDPQTGLPGQPGNCVIAAHRNVYGSWFYRVDQLQVGSVIALHTPEATYQYQVLKVVSASATDTSVRLPPAPDAPPRLTLYTCTMPHSPSRIVVVAQAVIDGNTL